MKLLAFETATEACSVALWIDGAVRERFELAPRRHAELALPWADALLAEAGVARSQLDAIAVGRGPGAFTGVRLAVAIAQGIALALDIPMLPVSTLAALSMRAPPGSRRILAAIDARMGEIYLGAFARPADGMVVALGDEVLVPPQQAIDWPRIAQRETVDPARQPWIGIGSGFAADDGALVAMLGDALERIDASALPHACDLARLAAAAYDRGETLAPERVEPAYLRDKVALTLGEQRKR
jgi:tRNA threonylcarbamoyladenosine biosynthesis protein TsaB